MKIRKSLIVLFLLSFGLTGCYTQLEYSQRVQRITDEEPVRGYAWSDEEEGDTQQDEKANLTVADSIYIAQTYGAKVDPYREGEYEEYAEDGYIPIEYKDYSVVEQYEECGCNPYKTYVIYNNNYYPSSWYYDSGYYYSSYRYNWRPYGYYHPFYQRHWLFHMGFDYYTTRFSLGFHWGFPYYHYRYYDPFFYDPFYYGYYGPIYYNTYYFGRYAGNVRYDRDNRRYGRRSIGADRVRDRNSSAVRGDRTGVTRSRAATSTVRSRSVGTERSRSRGTIDRTRSTTTRTRGTTRVGNSSRSRSDSGTRSRGTVTRSRSGGDGSSGTRSRSRSGVERDRNDQQSAIFGRRLDDRSTRRVLIPNASSRAELEKRIRQQRARAQSLDNYRRNSSRKSFFGRLNSIFDIRGKSNSFRRSSTRSSKSYGIHNRSGSNRSSVGRSRSSSRSKSTVTRSRSSSKSSPSRSRGSSSKKRSRDNN